MDWEYELRPQKFRDVRAQPQAVKQTAGRVVRGMKPRHVIYTGPAGSGKTTLIRILASAVNCDDIESDGSSCGVCGSCTTLAYHFVEWDTAGRGGDLEDVRWVLQQHVNSVQKNKFKIIFFDECHALKAQAQDALLKVIEDAPDNIVFCFATTEPSRMRTSFLSRLHEVRVYPISPSDAYDYLEWVARGKGIAFDPGAIHLLIAAKPPYFRDLIIGLQELAESGRYLTEEFVKEELGLHVCDHLVSYMMSLAHGDRSEQIRAFRNWPDDVVEKRIWVERFIASTYYNEVLGVEYVIDPLVHSLAIGRSSFVQSLQRRLRLGRAALLQLFEEMMRFWSTQSVPSAANVHLALSLFESMVCVGIAQPALFDQLGFDDYKGGDEGMQCGSAEARPTLASHYLSRADVRAIVNRASFFVQDRARHLNAAITLRFEGGSNLESRAEVASARCISILDAGFGSRPNSFAAIGVLEREQSAIVGRILAFVSPDWRDEFLSALSSWQQSSGIEVDTAFCLPADECAFQWKVVRDICASCDEVSLDGRDVRTVLGARRCNWRSAGPFEGRRVHFSRNLSAESIEGACYPSVKPLSAFDAGASKWIGSGWELKEASDRRREIVSRRLELDQLRFRWRHDPAQLEEKRASIFASWAQIGAEQRARRWQGWWSV